ncbi:hypothetical protein DFH27DRAFT_626679 [Peziza echinospora]|nr:hypothetical protein DFH27DRAFT_626679 [Peziza echinospora]
MASDGWISGIVDVRVRMHSGMANNFTSRIEVEEFCGVVVPPETHPAILAAEGRACAKRQVGPRYQRNSLPSKPIEGLHHNHHAHPSTIPTTHRAPAPLHQPPPPSPGAAPAVSRRPSAALALAFDASYAGAIIALARLMTPGASPSQLEAAHVLLLAAGFTCPFLLPSFFVPRRISRAGARAVGAIAQTRWTAARRTNFNRVWGKYVPLSQPGKIPSGNVLMEDGSNAKTRPECRLPLSGLSTTSHGIFAQSSSFQPIALAHSRSRQFSTSSIYFGATKKPSGKSKSIRTRKSSGPKGSKADVRRAVQQIRFGKKGGRSSLRKVAPKKPLVGGVLFRPITMQPPPKPAPVVSKSAPASSTEPKTTGQRRPKWVVAGVPRTKVKATGRKARRKAKKMASKGKIEEVAADLAEKSSVAQIEVLKKAPEPAPHIPKEPKEAVKVEKAGRVTGRSSRAARAAVSPLEPEKIAREIPKEEIIATSSGSRISVRGTQVDLTLGRGRKVSGRSVIVPGPAQRRVFSTCVAARAENKESDSGDSAFAADEKLSESSEVNTFPPEDSAIPKSQILQTENSPIIEDNQAAHTPRKDGVPTEDAGPEPDNDSIPATKSQSYPTIEAEIISEPYPNNKTETKIEEEEAVKNENQNFIDSGNAEYGDIVMELPSEDDISDDIAADGGEDGSSPEADLANIIGSHAKVSYPSKLLPLQSNVFPKRQKPPSVSSSSSATHPSKLLSYILSSPHLHPLQKRTPRFWVDVFEKWYLPKRVQDRLPETIKPTINKGPKLGPADALFSEGYIAPILPKLHIKCGASANDLIVLILEAKEGGVDLLVELGRIGHYSAVRWVVRRILHPQIYDVLDLEERNSDVLGSLSQENNVKLDDDSHESERISVSRAGDVGLDHLISAGLTKQKVMRIKLARQGLGLVLNSMGNMLVHADPSMLTSAIASPQHFSYSYSKLDKKEYSVSTKNTVWKNDYTLLLPLSKEILAYLHNCSLIPSNLYSAKSSRRLSILRQRILTSLADAVCQHQDLAEIGRLNPSTEDKNILEKSDAIKKRWSIYGYWRGGFEALAGNYAGNFWSSKGNSKRVPKKAKEELSGFDNVTNRGEREVLLEVVLRICALSGFGLAGTDILSQLVRQGGWTFIDYEATWPEEYRAEDLALREEYEGVSNLPGQWGVRGYSIMAPPIRTQKMALPQDLIKAMAYSIVDSVGEGKGLSAVIQALYHMSRLFGAEPVGISTSSTRGILSQVFKIWEDNFNTDPRSATIGEELLGHIRYWSNADERSQSEISPGEIHSELRIWYQVLKAYSDLENVEGALRVWEDLQGRMVNLVPNNFEPIYAVPNTKEWDQEVQDRYNTHYFHPPWVLGNYLSALTKGRRLPNALALIQTPRRSPFPIIPTHYYNLPPVTPHLLTLAALTRDHQLANEIVGSLPLKIPGAVPHSTLTSLVNMYLRLENFTSAQDVIQYMESVGVALDGTDIGILVENALRQSLAQGYNFVEQTEDISKADNSSPPGRNKVHSRWGDWALPHKSAAGLIDTMSATAESTTLTPKKPMKFTTFEGLLISTAPASKPPLSSSQSPSSKRPPTPKMSPSGWISVLNHSIESGDRDRAEWALTGLGVDIRKKQAISTKVFNILLKGVVKREGAVMGWVMINAHCLRDQIPSIYNTHNTLRNSGGKHIRSGGFGEAGGHWRVKLGKGREWMWVHEGKEQWGVRPDLVTYRTVLDQAVREERKMDEEEIREWEFFRERFGVAPPVMEGVVDGVGREDGPRDEPDLDDDEPDLDVRVHESRDRSGEEREAERCWVERQGDRRKKRVAINHVVELCREKMRAMSGL